jgi:uncharacterized protein (TIGR03083 family)
MQLAPRYGTDPLITLDGSPNDIAVPAIRQRRRLAAILATFTEAQWAHPSRCAGWSNRDVIVHLDSTNSFWAFAISEGVKGSPTQFLATFDPVSAPAQLVAGAAGRSAQDVLASFESSTEALVAVWATLADDEWVALAEAPPGHISVSALTHHALWDSWVHERDIVLPLGISPVEEADEIEACLRYAVALGPAFALTNGTSLRGRLGVDVTHPEVFAVVDIGDHVAVSSTGDVATDLTLSGDSVALLEALSIRRPLSQPVPDEHRWMLTGLAEVFDVATH